MCKDCRERNLERKRAQFMEPVVKPLKTGDYTSKSKKVWLDRFKARQADLKRDIERYQLGRQRGWEDNWPYRRIERHDWVAKRYREARAAAKQHGAL